MKKLFFGGIHPKYNKEMSTHITDFRTICPDVVVIPMQQHIGAPCVPQVAVGDRVLVGQKIGDGEGLCVPVHASVSGTVLAIEPRPHVSGRQVLAVVIENDGKNEEVTFAAAKLENLSDDEILHRIREAGIVGMGGAAFPGNVKALSAIGNVDTLIANACECEPYITADDFMLRTAAEDVMRGMLILKRLLNPNRVVLAVEDNKIEAIEKVKSLKETFADIELAVLPTMYPQGAKAADPVRHRPRSEARSAARFRGLRRVQRVHLCLYLPGGLPGSAFDPAHRHRFRRGYCRSPELPGAHRYLLSRPDPGGRRSA